MMVKSPKMRCHACGAPMRTERRETPLFTETRLHCTEREMHSEYQGMPRQWTGENTVATMRLLNKNSGGYFDTDGVKRLYPV